MITNEKQYKVSKGEARRFEKAVAEFDEFELIQKGIDPIIATAQRSALLEQLSDLESDIAQYEALRNGKTKMLVAESIGELGTKLIEARIAKGLSQKDLAERLDMKEQQIQRYERERYRAASLDRLAEISAALDVKFQSAIDVRIGETDQALLRGDAIHFDPEKLPVAEMRKRGWITSEKPERRAVGPVDYQAAATYVQRAMERPHLWALHRQTIRTGSEVDEYAVLAWKARILEKAKALRNVGKGWPQLNAEFIQSLVHLSAHQNGPVEAVRLLRKNGVAVVFEEHLKSTFLDGAAMMLDEETPVIGMTLRHDRLDNFWFVLMHELAHVLLHRDRGLREGFFDDESAIPQDRVEREADDYAQNALLSLELWHSSFVRFTRGRDDIVSFANRHRVGAAIVAGRIRNERRDYSVFSDLVGTGQVRRMFGEAGLLEA